MMGFQCMECKCNSSTFNDILGERVCDDCGLVYLTNPFEETVSWTGKRGKGREIIHNRDTGHLGSYIMNSDVKNRKDYTLRKDNIRTSSITSTDRHMYALSYNILWKYSDKSMVSLRERVPVYYRALQKNRILTGLNLETRSAGLTYFILKEAKVNISLKQHSIISSVSTSQIGKCAKKIAKFYRKSYIFSQQTPIEDAVKTLSEFPNLPSSFRQKTLKFVEYVHSKYQHSCLQYTHNTLGAIIWLSGRMTHNGQQVFGMTQQRLSGVVGGSEAGLRQSTHKICNLIGVDRENIEYCNIDDIVKGIR